MYFSFDILVMHLTFCVKLFLQCQLHGEVFTMFCTRKKTLLCMKCFRETSADAKSHCMDLETAYNVGGKRLERAITVSILLLGLIKQFQISIPNNKIFAYLKILIRWNKYFSVDERSSKFVKRWSDIISCPPR